MIVECPYLRYCFSLYNFQATAKKSICLFVRILVHKVRALMSQAFACKNYYIPKRYIRCHANKVLQKAIANAKTLGDEFVSLEHLFLAIVTSKDKTGNILRGEGLNEKDVKCMIRII